MNHAITLGDILLSIGALVGFLICAGGALATFAAGMASAPSVEEARTGCMAALIGAAIFGASLWGLLA